MSQNNNALRFDSILPDLKVTARKQVFQNLAIHVEKLVGKSSDLLAAELYETDKKERSGIGNGIAIPHAILPRLTKPIIIFTRAIYPVDFDAPDNIPVDLICLILSPSNEGTEHLRCLAKVSRFFNDKTFCNALRHAHDSEEIKAVLQEVNRQRLAAA